MDGWMDGRGRWELGRVVSLHEGIREIWVRRREMYHVARLLSW